MAEAAASAGSSSKWKMQITGQPPPPSSGSRFKKKPEREEWKEEQQMIDKRAMMSGKNGNFEESPRKGGQPPVPSPEKNMSVRKAMAMKEPPPKRPESPKKPKLLPPVKPMINPLVNPGQVVLDKFGNFRLMTPPELKKGRDDMPPLPPGAPPKGPAAGRAQSFRWLTIFTVTITTTRAWFSCFGSVQFCRHVAWLGLSSQPAELCAMFLVLFIYLFCCYRYWVNLQIFEYLVTDVFCWM